MSTGHCVDERAEDTAPGRKTSRTKHTDRPTLAEPLVVARWSKNRKGDAITLSLRSFEGFNLFDLRTYWPAKDGTLKPGKGFACRVTHLPQLAEAIDRALSKARELGLVEAEA